MEELKVGPTIKHLSPSKVARAIEQCSLKLKWEQDYKEQGIPLPINWGLVAGRALHKGIEIALKEVKAGHPLPDAPKICEATVDQWNAEVKEAKNTGTPIVTEDDSEGDIQKGILALAPIVREKVLVKLRPKRIEEPVKEWVVRDGVKFLIWGQLDYEDEDLTILDWKTTAEVSRNANKKDIQCCAYGWWQGRAEGVEVTKIQKVFLVWKRTPRVQPSEMFSVFSYDREFFESSAVSVWKMAQSGAYVPNIGGWWCSPDWCNFYKECRGGGL